MTLKTQLPKITLVVDEEGNETSVTGSNLLRYEKLLGSIKRDFRTGDVKDVTIDMEFGNVTATVRGQKNRCCGWVSDNHLGRNWKAELGIN